MDRNAAPTTSEFTLRLSQPRPLRTSGRHAATGTPARTAWMAGNI